MSRVSSGPRSASALRLCGLLLGLFLVACAGGGGGDAGTPRVVDPPLAAADINLLFLGNSHTHFHDVPGMVAEFVRSARPGKSVHAEAAPGYLFLDERLHDPATLAQLNSRRWSAVFLQAQRYSSSGQFSYSTSEAEALARMSRNLGATPVMFPEWPRRGVPETARIHDLHAGIARTAPACLAPVGQAWDAALSNGNALVLHDADGNHSAPAGAMLAAMVLASAVTGADPRAFPFLAQRDVDAASQQQLRAAAGEAISRHPPRSTCPGDPLLP